MRLALSSARSCGPSQTLWKSQTNWTSIRNYARGPVRGRTIVEQPKAPTLKERLMAPPSANAYSMGKGAAAGAAAVGMGALCYYGIGQGKQNTIANNSLLWPQFVKDRIHTTYGYFGASCALTALCAAGVFRSPRLLSMVTRDSFMFTIASIAAVIGSGALARSIEYQPGFGAKQLAYALHCAVLGAVIAPICFLGGPILTRAALYTGGIVGGLSTIAVCAPNDKFLYMGGPLAIGLGVVFVSSLASMWLPPTTALGAGLASMSLYGGLVLFSGFLLYDTQKLVRKAECYPQYAMQPFDPINNAMSIFIDVLNIFVRLATILGGRGGNKK